MQCLFEVIRGLEEILFSLMNQQHIVFFFFSLVGFYHSLLWLFVCCAVVPLWLSGT